MAGKLTRWLVVLEAVGLVALTSGGARGAAPGERFAGQYLVVIKSLPPGQDEAAALRPWSSYHPLLVHSDELSGLRPGYDVVVASAHPAKAAATQAAEQLRRAGVDSYVRYAGKAIAAAAPDAKQVTDWAHGHIDKSQRLQALTISSRGRTFPLLVAYQPLPNWNEDTVEPATVRGGARLFLFLSPTPIEIAGHGFCTPDDPSATRERPFLSCEPAKVHHLSDRSKEPSIIAQQCGEGNRLITRFVVFGETNLHEPALGTAASAPGSAGTSPRERFVPASEALAEGGRSPYRGDGKTVVDGEEVEPAGEGMRRRSYRVEWDGQDLRKKAGPWQRLR